MKEHILVVEDELGIATMEKNYLEKSGFQTTIAHDGNEAVNLFTRIILILFF